MFSRHFTIFVQAILVLVIFITQTGAVVRQCPSKRGSARVDLSAIQISGCRPGDQRCKLIRGKSADMTIPFMPVSSSQSLESRVFGILGGIIPVPFPLADSNACGSQQGVSCPLQPGSLQKYYARLPVSHDYPKIKVDVMWQLVNERDETVVCIIFPAQLTDI